jgi:hypothetical protein
MLGNGLRTRRLAQSWPGKKQLNYQKENEMPAHLLAQNAALFLLTMVGVIVLAGWLEWRHG